MALLALAEPALMEGQSILTGALFDEDDKPVTTEQIKAAVDEWRGSIDDVLDYENHEHAVSWQEWLMMPAIFKDVITIVKQFRESRKKPR